MDIILRLHKLINDTGAAYYEAQYYEYKSVLYASYVEIFARY